MNTITRNLTGALLVAATALGTGQSKSAPNELRLSDIRAQQPDETIFASTPCQRARESPQESTHRFAVYPGTFVADLRSLFERSDEVILAANLDFKTVISPTGESTASYFDVTVVHSWKGPHGAGDTLTYGEPGGSLACSAQGVRGPIFSAVSKTGSLDGLAQGPFVYVLFLKHAQGTETQFVQGLLPAAGDGLEGKFRMHVNPPYPSEREQNCAGLLEGNVQHCYSYLQTSDSPVMLSHSADPLAGKYHGMPTSEFLREVQAIAVAEESAQKSSPN